MKSTLFVLFIIFNILAISQGSKASPSLTVQIKKNLGSLWTQTSLSVRNEAGQELAQVNGHKDRAPASIAKTVSTACALEALGPDFQFHTHFGWIGQIEKDQLKGSLVLTGEGDPSLVLEDLRETLQKIRTLYGVRKISGPLIFQTHYFPQSQWPLGDGFEGDEGRSFATVLTPLPLTQNSFSIWAVPNPDPSQPPMVSVIPAGVLNFQIESTVRMGKSSQISVGYRPDRSAVKVSGTLAYNDIKTIYRGVPDPYSYYNQLIHRLWLDSGGEWSAQDFKIESQEIAVHPFIDLDSKPLSKILMDINKYSLNLGAELTLLAAARGDSHSTNPSLATAFLQKCLAAKQIPEGTIYLNNASGLSREARIQASSLSLFLQKMLRSDFAPEYLSSLSLAGLDGTTKSRLKNLKGKARLKTGSIKNVSSIAGYVFSPTGRPVTFALIMNGVQASEPRVKKTQDLVIQTIYRSLLPEKEQAETVPETPTTESETTED